MYIRSSNQPSKLVIPHSDQTFLGISVLDIIHMEGVHFRVPSPLIRPALPFLSTCTKYLGTAGCFIVCARYFYISKPFRALQPQLPPDGPDGHAPRESFKIGVVTRSPSRRSDPRRKLLLGNLGARLPKRNPPSKDRCTQ